MIILQIVLSHADIYVVLFLDLLLIMLLDPLDSLPMRMKYGDEWSWTSTYQYLDKVGDILLEFMALILFLSRSEKQDETFAIILTSLFIYRFIGVMLYILTGQSIFLIIFPNFFLENVMLYILLAKMLHLPNPIVWTLVGISIPVKIAAEYIHHQILPNYKELLHGKRT